LKITAHQLSGTKRPSASRTWPAGVCIQARARLMFSMAMWMAAFVAPVQLVLGDLHGGNTYH
jgi:cytochrome bd-type quinol oxidase subunit 1